MNIVKKWPLFLSLLILFAACPGRQSSPGTTVKPGEKNSPGPGVAETLPESITILVPKSTSSLPFLYLETIGLTGEMKLKVELFTNHPQALAALQRGEAQYLYTGTTLGWANYLDGGPLRMIKTGVWGVSYMLARKDLEIKSPRDLGGKKMAFPFPGAPLDLQTGYILKKEGFDPQDPRFIYYEPFSQSSLKVVLGQLDCAPFPEPMATMLVKNKNLVRLFSYVDLWAQVTGGDGAAPQVSLFALEEWGREHTGTTALLVREWKEATAYVTGHAEEMGTLFAGLFELPEEIVTEAVNNTLYGIREDDREQLILFYNLVNDTEEGGELLKNLFFHGFEGDE